MKTQVEYRSVTTTGFRLENTNREKGRERRLHWSNDRLVMKSGYRNITTTLEYIRLKVTISLVIVRYATFYHSLADGIKFVT